MREERLISDISTMKLVLADEKLSSWSLDVTDTERERERERDQNLLQIYLLGGSVQYIEELTQFT